MFCTTALSSWSAARISLSVAVAAAGLAPFGAGAQTVPPQLPSAAEPGREIPRPRLEPTQQPSGITVQEAPSVEAPPGAERFTFRLAGVAIEGATAYPEAELRRYYEKLIGTEVNVATMFGVAAEIERRYRADGFVTSRAIVPRQTIEDGTFHITVVEGFINEIVYADAVGPARPTVEKLIAPLRNTAPVNIRDIERRLLLADDLPGMTVRGTLEAAPELRGASRLIITTERKPFDFAATFDNRGSRYNTREGVLGSVAANSFGPHADRAYVIGKVGLPARREYFAGGGYQLNLGDNGMTANMTVTKSHSHPGRELTPLEVYNDVFSVTAGVSYPIIRSRLESLRVDGGFEYRNVDTELLSQDFTEDRLRLASVGATYDLVDSFDGVNTVRVAYIQGIDIAGATGPGSPLLSRAEGRSDTAKVVLQATRIQSLPADFSVMLSFAGQMAWDPLLASEEFAVGGGVFGRGYNPGEITGDRGFATTVELRYTPTLVRRWLEYGAQLYAFHDYGRVWNLDSTADPDSESLSSVGVGLRVNLTENISGYVEGAKPLTRRIATTGDKAPQAFFGVTVNF